MKNRSVDATSPTPFVKPHEFHLQRTPSKNGPKRKDTVYVEWKIEKVRKYSRLDSITFSKCNTYMYAIMQCNSCPFSTGKGQSSVDYVI